MEKLRKLPYEMAQDFLRPFATMDFKESLDGALKPIDEDVTPKAKEAPWNLSLPKGFVFYVRHETPQPNGVVPVDSHSDIVAGHYAKIGDPLTQFALMQLLDGFSDSRLAAFRADYVSRQTLEDAAKGGKMMLVEDPKYETTMSNLKSGARNVLDRMGVIETYAKKADELSEEFSKRKKPTSTAQHFKRLYDIVKTQGLGAAIRQDLNATFNGSFEPDEFADNYSRALSSYAGLHRKSAAELQGSIEKVHAYTDADSRRLAEIADTVVEFEKHDPKVAESLLGSMAIANSMVPDEKKAYLSRLFRRKAEGIDSTLTFAADAKRGYIDLDGNSREAMHYAEVKPAMEKRFGSEARSRYERSVAHAREAGLSLKDSIKVGISIAADEADLQRAGGIIAKSNNLEGDAAKAFGHIYSVAAKGDGLEDATRTFVPAFFKTLKEAADLGMAELNISHIAEHVDPAMAFFRENPDYRRVFDSIIHNAFMGATGGISKTPQDSFAFAKACVDTGRSGYDVQRWGDKTKAYAQAGLSLANSMKLAGAFEAHAQKNGGTHQESRLAEVLKNTFELLNGTGTTQDAAVDAAIHCFSVDGKDEKAATKLKVR